jgi:hypothetical protein
MAAVAHKRNTAANQYSRGRVREFLVDLAGSHQGHLDDATDTRLRLSGG